MTASAVKVCPACNDEKPLNAFARNSKRKDGVDCYCKACRATKAREIRRQARTTAKSARPTTSIVVRDTAATDAATRPDSGASTDGRDWPVPLSPDEYPARLVRRRERVIEIVGRYRELRRQGPNRGRPGPTTWRRKVYGDGRTGEGGA
jgi:hypothetical protein